MRFEYWSKYQPLGVQGVIEQARISFGLPFGEFEQEKTSVWTKADGICQDQE